MSKDSGIKPLVEGGSPSDGDTLVFSAAKNGWVPGEASGGSSETEVASFEGAWVKGDTSTDAVIPARLIKNGSIVFLEFHNFSPAAVPSGEQRFILFEIPVGYRPATPGCQGVTTMGDGRIVWGFNGNSLSFFKEGADGSWGTGANWTQGEQPWVDGLAIFWVVP